MLLLVLAAVLLRVLLLWERPLWFDELFTSWASRLSVPDLISILRLDSGPPGFYLLEKPFGILAARLPHYDTLLRLPCWLAGLLLFAAAGTLPEGATRARFVALLCGSTLINLYSGEARPYAALALASLILFLLALRGREGPGRLSAIVAVGAALLYLHYLAVFAIAAMMVLTLRARRWRSSAALLASGALFAPWVPVLLAQPPDAVAWMREPFGRTAVGFLSALGGVGRIPSPFGGPAPAVLFYAGAVLGALSLGLFLVEAFGPRDAGARPRPDAPDALLFVALVLLGALTANVWRPVAFAGRSELAVLPVWIWGLAFSARSGKPLRWACFGIVAAGFLTTADVALRPHPPSAPLAVAETVARVAAPGDLVVASASFYLPARLAADRGSLTASVEALPAEQAAHPGWFVPSLPGPPEEALLAAALRRVPPGRRLFLIVPPVYLTEGLGRVLSQGAGRTRSLMRTPDASVTLWTRNRREPGRSD